MRNRSNSIPRPTEFLRLTQIRRRGSQRLPFGLQPIEPHQEILALLLDRLVKLPFLHRSLLQVKNGLIDRLDGRVRLLDLRLARVHRLVHALHFELERLVARPEIVRLFE